MNAGRKARVGICGAGRISRFHADGFVRAGAEIAAFADPRIDAAHDAATPYGARSYASLSQMLMSEDLDVVCIATPHDLHVSQATEALAAGLDVFMDKPLALTPEDGRNLVTLAERLWRRLGVNHNLLFHPSVVEARAVLRSGEIGDIVSANAWSTGWLDLTPTDFRRNRTKTGGGAWFDAGPHLVYLLADLVGPFKKLSAFPSERGSRLGGEDTVVAMGLFASGQVASMRISYSYRAPSSDLAWPAGWYQGLEVNGTEGALRLSVTPTGSLETWRLGQDGWVSRLADAPFSESFDGAIRDFVNARDIESAGNASAEQSVRVLEWITGALATT